MTKCSLNFMFVVVLIGYGKGLLFHLVVLHPPKNVVFYKSKLFWLYLDKEYEDYPRYRYTIYWFDVIKNDWGFSFVPISDIRCMSLEIYMNQLICLVIYRSTSVWSIEELDHFQFGHCVLNEELNTLKMIGVSYGSCWKKFLQI